MMHLPPNGRSRWNSVLAVVLLGAVALAPVGCNYDNHRTMGMTEKFAASSINQPTKVFGTIILGLVDAVLSPFEYGIDAAEMNWGDKPRYDPDFEYFSYAGARVIARSDLDDEYKFIAGFWAIVAETIWLPLTGIIDGVTILVEDDGIAGN